jgi:hypothetical protein
MKGFSRHRPNMGQANRARAPRDHARKYIEQAVVTQTRWLEARRTADPGDIATYNRALIASATRLDTFLASIEVLEKMGHAEEASQLLIDTENRLLYTLTGVTMEKLGYVDPVRQSVPAPAACGAAEQDVLPPLRP